MKKQLLVTAIGLAIVLGACSNKAGGEDTLSAESTTVVNDSTTTDRTGDTTETSIALSKAKIHLKYSNLVDNETRERVKKALANAGVSDEKINKFFEAVDEYNNAVGSKNLVQEMTSIEAAFPTFDQDKLIDAWLNKSQGFVGRNCRITSYSLMGDSIKVGNKTPGDTTMLFNDFDAINEKKIFVSTPEPFENKRRDLTGEFQNTFKDKKTYKSSDDEINWTVPKENMYNPRDDMSLIKDEKSNSMYIDINDFNILNTNISDTKSDTSVSTNNAVYNKNFEVGNVSNNIKPSQLSFFDSESKKYMKVVGQVFDTYWIVQLEKELYIIDQHAAHEKVMYERLLKESKENRPSSQMINPPVIVTLTDVEQNVLKDHMDEFRKIGFEGSFSIFSLK